MKKMRHPLFTFTYQQLLTYGVHIGHSISNSILYAAWLVYTYKQNILIINMYKTLQLLNVGLRCFALSVYHRSPVWFVNLDKAASIYSKVAASNCGEMSWTIDWVHGMIANFMQMQKVFSKLQRDQIPWSYKIKNRWAIEKGNDWFSTRSTWPRTVLISSVHRSKYPVKEALYLGIPCIGVVDTNTNSNHVIIPIPGNDDSLDCLMFYAESISNYIMIKKFDLVMTWYLYRKPTRLLSFKQWMYQKFLASAASDDKYPWWTAEKKKDLSSRIYGLNESYYDFTPRRNLSVAFKFFAQSDSRLGTSYSYEVYYPDNAGDFDPYAYMRLFQYNAFWWQVLSSVNAAKYVWTYGIPLMRRKRKWSFHRRLGRIGRRRGYRVWNNEKYFRTNLLRTTIYARMFNNRKLFRYLKPAQWWTGLYGFTRKYLKFFYLHRYNTYSIKSTILNPFVLPNFYVKLVSDTLGFKYKHRAYNFSKYRKGSNIYNSELCNFYSLRSTIYPTKLFQFINSAHPFFHRKPSINFLESFPYICQYVRSNEKRSEVKFKRAWVEKMHRLLKKWSRSQLIQSCLQECPQMDREYWIHRIRIRSYLRRMKWFVYSDVPTSDKIDRLDRLVRNIIGDELYTMNSESDSNRLNKKRSMNFLRIKKGMVSEPEPRLYINRLLYWLIEKPKVSINNKFYRYRQ